MSESESTRLHRGDTEVRQTLLGLEIGSEYAIRVRSVDGLGNKSEWSEAYQFTASDSAQSSPLIPANVRQEWKGRDLHISWDAVFSNVDGTAADVAFYEFHLPLLIDAETWTFATYRSHIATGQTFTYTYEQNATDHGGTASDSFGFMIVAVSRQGFRSARTLTAARFATHAAPQKPSPPTVTAMGSSLLIQMDRGEDCFETFTLEYSTDGGDTWTTEGSETTTDAYVFTPESTSTHFFRYLITDAYGLTSEVSNSTYGSSLYNPPDPVGDWDDTFDAYLDRDRVWFGGSVIADFTLGTHSLGTLPEYLRPNDTVTMSVAAFVSAAPAAYTTLTVESDGSAYLSTDETTATDCVVPLEGVSYRITRP